MSIVQAFLRGVDKYDVDGSIVVYFCFPTLGVAIPLQPGDYLIFNPLIPNVCLQDAVIPMMFFSLLCISKLQLLAQTTTTLTSPLPRLSLL